MRQRDSKIVCVIGLGYVGLPTACLLANFGYHVVGVDVDNEILERIQAADLLYPEPGLQDLLLQALSIQSLELSIAPCKADIYIITVPTPVKSNNTPDLGYINAAIESIAPYVGPESLVIIESTCPVGTTDAISNKLRSMHPSLSVAYCPERMLPGNAMYELANNDRIIGGVDESSTIKATQFYKSFVSGEMLTTNSATAEAVKLVENTYRDINIAYANELSMISDKLGLCVHELISLANRHPRVNILTPGVGVGGHCIAVDPYFLLSSTSETADLATAARKVNNRKPEWVMHKITQTAKAHNITRMAFFGLTYKANVSDFRNSPALIIANSFNKDFQIMMVDPYLQDSCTIKDAIHDSDMIVILVAHNEFYDLPTMLPKNKVLLDFTGNKL